SLRAGERPSEAAAGSLCLIRRRFADEAGIEEAAVGAASAVEPQAAIGDEVVRGAEHAGVTGDPAHGVGVAVVHFTPDEPPPPRVSPAGLAGHRLLDGGAVLGRGDALEERAIRGVACVDHAEGSEDAPAGEDV